jgi:hypothetical protein
MFDGMMGLDDMMELNDWKGISLALLLVGATAYAHVRI